MAGVQRDVIFNNETCTFNLKLRYVRHTYSNNSILRRNERRQHTNEDAIQNSRNENLPKHNRILDRKRNKYIKAACKTQTGYDG